MQRVAATEPPPPRHQSAELRTRKHPTDTAPTAPFRSTVFTPAWYTVPPNPLRRAPGPPCPRTTTGPRCATRVAIFAIHPPLRHLRRPTGAQRGREFEPLLRIAQPGGRYPAAAPRLAHKMDDGRRARHPEASEPRRQRLDVVATHDARLRQERGCGLEVVRDHLIPAVLEPSLSQLRMPRSSRSASSRAMTSYSVVGDAPSGPGKRPEPPAPQSGARGCRSDARPPIHTPCVTTKCDRVDRTRSALRGANSGESHHAWKRSMSGNSRITQRDARARTPSRYSPRNRSSRASSSCSAVPKAASVGARPLT